MLKNFLLILIIPLLMGASCSTTLKNKKITNTETYKKKVECNNLFTDIETAIAQDNQGGVREQIFYSPKQNTCLYVAAYFGSAADPQLVALKDALTNATLESVTLTDWYDANGKRKQSVVDKLEDFYKLVETYK